MNVYKDLFEKATLEEIVLALISIIKVSQNADKSSAMELFDQLTIALNMQNFRIIESATMNGNITQFEINENNLFNETDNILGYDQNVFTIFIVFE